MNAALEALHRESEGWVGSVVAGQTVRSPLVPRPLGMVEDLGLLLSEMVEPDADPWKPRITRAPGGEPSDLNLPAQKLLCAATAMARLHGSRTPIFAAAPRTSSGEVAKMRERAARLAEANPVQADMVLALAERLADRLEAAQPEVLLPGHGSFKPTQMLCGLGRPS